MSHLSVVTKRHVLLSSLACALGALACTPPATTSSAGPSHADDADADSAPEDSDGSNAEDDTSSDQEDDGLADADDAAEDEAADDEDQAEDDDPAGDDPSTTDEQAADDDADDSEDMRDASVDADAEDDGSSDGWSSVRDGGVGATDAGEQVTVDAGECRPIAHNVASGPFGTTDAVCFVVSEQPPVAWAAYAMEGRTITINGTVVSSGQLPFPGSAPFIVVFSAGTYDYASWSYW